MLTQIGFALKTDRNGSALRPIWIITLERATRERKIDENVSRL